MKPTSQKTVKQCVSCNGSQLLPYLKLKDFFLTNEEFKLYICQTCGLILTYPVPNEIEIEKYYQSPNYYSHSSNAKNLTSILYKIIRNFNIKRKYKFIKSFNTGDSILDYGCGSGQLLNHFKRKGWKIHGVEKNIDAKNFASELNSIEIFENLEQYKSAKTQFEVIMLWHVLEHIHKLNETISEFANLLKSSGILIIAVPNPYSRDALNYKEYWAAYDVPRHLYHFSRTSMVRLLSKHNFHIIDIQPMKFDTYYISLLSEKYKGNNFPYFRALLEGYKSNRDGRKSNNYSSMIFVAQKK